VIAGNTGATPGKTGLAMTDAPRLIDLQHVGNDGEIAAWVVGDVLVDCGPTTCLPRLLAGLNDVRPRVLLLTHIHLDHAGAAGTLVERWPELEVHVHPVGLPHLADPSKLQRSAGRLYGDDMAWLWGEIRPVPDRNLRPLADGARVEGFLAAHTPGHASHHVAFFREESGHAFPGDATGVRLGGSDLIMPHAPPPDIDLEAWDRSLDLIESWDAEALCLPHFGEMEDVGAHLELMRDALRRKAGLARDLDLTDFIAEVDSELAGLTDLRLADRYRHTSPAEHMHRGLQRYWDKQLSPR
jgi:glyoxylase-like metal-dependent hydrolase (beta-lactamase superfamily II)